MRSFYGFTLEGLRMALTQAGLAPIGAARLFNWHYKHKHTEACTTDLAQATIQFVKDHISFDLPQIEQVQESDDRTVKFLFRLADGKKVETVLIPSFKKYGICLSSQVGCAMKCSFCHTGLQGLERHLETSEIVGQYLAAQGWLNEHRPSNNRIATIVFMGQGEPLHNFDAVKGAIEIFLSQYGLSLAADKITISTAGFLPGLKRWKDEMPDVNIALSLHSTITEKRNKLIPINAKYPFQEIIALVDELPKKSKAVVIYEYLVTKGFNDSEADARHLGETLKGKRAFVNLIPFNPFPGADYERPERSGVDAIKKILEDYGVPSLVRYTKGSDILAACGQLNSR
ncbi:MAG: 23S rRNA (adenine(2503)-C(2))-methyltransferase RlmN [Proteobacteria bacterium]|nr:23S rRNA (adenine(2503)-C(2))-methyltransferase RlmN [Pseudomonadota bacterium]